MGRAFDADLERGVFERPTAAEFTPRSQHKSISPEHFDIEIGRPSARPRGQVLPAATLRAVRGPTGVMIHSLDGRFALDVVEAFEDALLSATIAQFSFASPRRHQPRVVIDDLVVARETWHLLPDEFSFARLPRGSEQYLAAFEWARSLGLPRHVFIKVPHEMKPIFGDFTSPYTVEVFCRQLRSASLVTVSEMLPDTSALWLPDSDGQRYTCELRCVAVDALPWRKPG